MTNHDLEIETDAESDQNEDCERGRAIPQSQTPKNYSSLNRIRITPISVPRTGTVQKLGRIVNKGNQVVDIVVANDLNDDETPDPANCQTPSQTYKDSTNGTISNCSTSSPGTHLLETSGLQSKKNQESSNSQIQVFPAFSTYNPLSEMPSDESKIDEEHSNSQIQISQVRSISSMALPYAPSNSPIQISQVRFISSMALPDAPSNCQIKISQVRSISSKALPDAPLNSQIQISRVRSICSTPLPEKPDDQSKITEEPPSNNKMQASRVFSINSSPLDKLSEDIKLNGEGSSVQSNNCKPGSNTLQISRVFSGTIETPDKNEESNRQIQDTGVYFGDIAITKKINLKSDCKTPDLKTTRLDHSENTLKISRVFSGPLPEIEPPNSQSKIKEESNDGILITGVYSRDNIPFIKTADSKLNCETPDMQANRFGDSKSTIPISRVFSGNIPMIEPSCLQSKHNEYNNEIQITGVYSGDNNPMIEMSDFKSNSKTPDMQTERFGDYKSTMPISRVFSGNVPMIEPSSLQSKDNDYSNDIQITGVYSGDNNPMTDLTDLKSNYETDKKDLQTNNTIKISRVFSGCNSSMNIQDLQSPISTNNAPIIFQPNIQLKECVEMNKLRSDDLSTCNSPVIESTNLQSNKFDRATNDTLEIAGVFSECSSSLIQSLAHAENVTPFLNESTVQESIIARDISITNSITDTNQTNVENSEKNVVKPYKIKLDTFEMCKDSHNIKAEMSDISPPLETSKASEEFTIIKDSFVCSANETTQMRVPTSENITTTCHIDSDQSKNEKPPNDIIAEMSNADLNDYIFDTTDFNSTLPCHETRLSNINDKESQVIKTECDQPENDNTLHINNTDDTNNGRKLTSESDKYNILAHFLKARVVVERLSITYESENSDIPDPSIATDSSELENKGEEETIQVEESEVKIKEEPWIDIQSQLDELGDNFTTTIIDIQDPFLVVEISSDSSSDDED